MEKKSLGLIINPIAGMGGSVGLKGTDNMVEEAIKRGAVPKSNQRTALALQELLPIAQKIIVYTAKGDIGETLAQSLGFETVCIDFTPHGSREDTLQLAQALQHQGVDLLLFSGGDGTARDVYESVGTELVAVGIPAGVKIHSPVYCKKPADAGKLAYQYLTGKISQTTEAEVLDIDEQLYREEIITTRLYGYLRIPLEKSRTQSRKAATPLSEGAAIESIAHDIVEHMEPDVYYIIGAGTTLRGIMTLLGLKNTLIGVDIVLNKQLVASDVYGDEILKIIGQSKAKLVITVTGGQGFLFGRGNQQLTPAVIRAVGRENIIIAATKQKLYSLRGQPFLVDTSDPMLDKELEGYYKVITSYREQMICKIF